MTPRALIAALALGAGLCLAAAAQPVSPACALLTETEATDLLGGKPVMTDGGPEAAGAATCLWFNASEGRSIGVQTMGASTFGASGQTAAVYFENLVAGMTNAGEVLQEVAGLGDRAILVHGPGGIGADDPAGHFVVCVLKGEAILTAAIAGLTRDQAVEVSRTIAGRM